jgi:FtsP/CotA-like multicopper oxidase with cupredoxin domain
MHFGCFSNRPSGVTVNATAGPSDQTIEAEQQLRISPAERFEILVDFTNGKPVMLETGPDQVMGIFGALSQDGTAEYVAVMRFEPTATRLPAKTVPAHLVEPAAADPRRAIRRRQFVLENWTCSNRRPVGVEMDMDHPLCINGKTHELARIDVETELGMSCSPSLDQAAGLFPARLRSARAVCY